MSFNLTHQLLKLFIPILGLSFISAALVLFSFFGLFSWFYWMIGTLFVLIFLFLFLIFFSLFSRFSLGFSAYVSMLSIIGIAAPVILALTVTAGFENEFFVYYIPMWKETMIVKTLHYSYLLIFPYLLTFYGIFITLHTGLIRKIFLPTSKEIPKDHRIENVCERLAKKMEVKTPRLFFVAEPTVYSFGLNKNKGSIALYEKCAELDDSTLETIISHELVHIGSDVKHHTLQLLFTRTASLPSFLVFNLPFVFSVVWFLHDWLDMFFLANAGLGTLEQIAAFFNYSLPLLLSLTSFLLVFFARFYIYLPIGLERPVIEMSEFKADLLTYLMLGKADVICNSLDRFRRLQVLYHIENPSLKHSQFYRIKEIYNKAMSKALSPKSYPNWLGYFRENYAKLNQIFGKALDFPEDRLRKDFVEFIDRTVNGHNIFQINDPKKPNYDKVWAIKSSIKENRVAMVDWLQGEVHNMQMEKKRKIVGYIWANANDFNAKECSKITQTTLYETIVILSTLLTEGRLSIKNV